MCAQHKRSKRPTLQIIYIYFFKAPDIHLGDIFDYFHLGDDASVERAVTSGHGHGRSPLEEPWWQASAQGRPKAPRGGGGGTRRPLRAEGLCARFVMCARKTAKRQTVRAEEEEEEEEA